MIGRVSLALLMTSADACHVGGHHPGTTRLQVGHCLLAASPLALLENAWAV